MDNLNLFHELEALLRADSKYCMDDGTLIKNKIVSYALSLNPELLRYLLSHESLKKNFFSELDGILIFDKVKFQQFVMNKSFLPDSYTAYKNKIGLTSEDGRFISESREVVLAWPYKDCMLEGGQTKEDAKRNEVFWSETLAPDEINRLTEPKAFTGFKRYDKEGKHDVDHILSTDNLIIKGNNLLALYSIRKRFANRVKLIYIDPPYNTGDDGFGYNDAFNHSTWLTFMKNRLEVAKELLSEDGAIFMHIDLHELAYISVLADSVFDIENRVQIISVKTATPAGFKTVNPGPIDVTEYILFYTKNKSAFNFKKGYVPVGYNVNYNLFIVNPNDKAEEWEFIPIKDALLEQMGFASEKEAKKKYGTLWKSISKELIQQFAFENASRVVSVRDPHKPTATVKELMAKSRETDKVISMKREDSETSYCYKGGALAFYSNKLHKIDGELTVTELLTDFWSHISWAGIANEGGVKLKNGKKPEKLLKQIIELTTEKNDIVLDFFLGCGTTAAVAHKLGRQYIGVEQLDYGNNDSVVRLNNVVRGDGTGVSKAVNWQGGGSFVYCELAKANQQFIESIEAAETHEALMGIWQQMQATGYLNYKINISTIDESAIDFAALSLDDQKRFLMECLDKNMLYIPVNDMESEEYAISEEDKRLTKEFYKKN